MKKRELVPAAIAAAAAIIFLTIILNLPSMKLIGIDWRIAILAGLGVLTFKIYRWSQNLFAEIPP